MRWPTGKAALACIAACAVLLASTRSRAQDEPSDNAGWFDPSADDGAPSSDADTPPPPSSPEPVAPSISSDPGSAPDTDASALQEFRPTLDPYGSWVADPTYGTVWVPNAGIVGSDFAPYVTAGHWALSTQGDWVWESDYPFGGVVFHYGRWIWISGHGWAWVPGRQYAPAWVTWRVPVDGYPYVGWAPLPPSYVWFGGAAVWLWFTPRIPFVFCPSAYVFAPGVHLYVVRNRHVVRNIAYHTRRYGSQPVAHTAASPHSTPGSFAAPRGPSLQSANIPSYAAPTERVAASPARFDPSARAVGAARPSFNRAGVYSSRGVSRAEAPAYRSAPAYSTPTYRAPSQPLPLSYRSPSGPAYRAPSAVAPVYRSPAPVYRAPSAPAPVYRAPSAPAPVYRSPSAPAPVYRVPSAPAPVYRAPSAPTYRSPSTSTGRSFGGSSFHSSFHSFGGGRGHGGRR